MKYKRLLIFIFVIILLVNFSFQPSFAIDPITLTSGFVAFTKLMLAGGVAFWTVDGAVSAYNEWKGLPNNTAHQLLEDACNSAVNGIINVTSDIWSSIKSYIFNNYQEGEGLRNIPEGTVLQPNIHYVIDLQLNQIISLMSGTTLEYPRLKLAAQNATFNTYEYQSGDSGPVTLLHKYATGAVATFYYTIHNQNSTHVQLRYFIKYFNYLDNWVTYDTLSGVGLNIPKTAISDTYVPVNYNGFPYVSSLNQPYFNTNTGTNEMSVSGNASNYINKTPYDVLNEDLTVPQYPAISFPNSWYGSFADSGAIGGTWSGQWTQGNNTTDKPMVGVPGSWLGQWTRQIDGTMDWTGIYTDASGNVWEGVISDVIDGTLSINPPIDNSLSGILGWLSSFTSWLTNLFVLPATVSLNFTPLTGIGLTNKFPFSIPWDFYNAIESLNADPEVPRWELPIVDEIVILDFAIFNPIARIIRWGVLVSFTFSLILITRSLIKG